MSLKLTNISINEIMKTSIEVPTPNYRLKLVIMLTLAKAQKNDHVKWLVENEWVATVAGQRV